LRLMQICLLLGCNSGVMLHGFEYLDCRITRWKDKCNENVTSNAATINFKRNSGFKNVSKHQK
jgi:hypothetical protein